jgi:type II secretion system protein N
MSAAPRLTAPPPHGRRGPLIALYALIGALVFISFLVATFPYSVTLSSLLAPCQIRVRYASQRMSPPFGARLDDVTLVSTAGGAARVVLASPSVVLTPTLASLLLGRSGIRVRADLFGGRVRVTIRRAASATDFAFGATAIQLAAVRGLPLDGAELAGDISTVGNAALAGPALTDANGRATLAGGHITVSIASGMAPVRVGVLSGALELAGGVLKLVDIETHGADLDLKADGEIQLGPTPDESQLNVTLYLEPTRSGRDHFGFFLHMLPHPPANGAPYTIGGTLAAPTFN